MKNEIIPYNPKLKALARELRSRMTPGEVRLWKVLKNKGLLGYDFDRQRPVDDYIVDFYCKGLKLVIEIDGSSHDNSESIENDSIREERLKKFGISIIRFKEIDVLKDIERVVLRIEEWILENQ